METVGWIATDIDGTITHDKYRIPQEILSFLEKKVSEGYRLVLTTGRPFTFASMALKECTFPYYFCLQNGSLVMQMPEKKVLWKNDFPEKAIALVEKAYSGFSSDFVVYAGYEKGDFCYWRPSKLNEKHLKYLEDVQRRQSESWRAVTAYENLDPHHFPLIKCFGTDAEMGVVEKRLKEHGLFQLTKIRDPFDADYFILLVTDLKASKGQALTQLINQYGRGKKVIAAGDDMNDYSLLQVADRRIAMDKAPLKLKSIAHSIASSATTDGIIQAIEEA